MKLLDLFCGAGGAGMGYHLAGFDVVGVDINPQPNYPFEFVQGDALEYLLLHGRRFDVIHASPPCQAYSEATPIEQRASHPDLIDPVRNALLETGKPYIIENVENARGKLRNPMMLCGTMFGLKVWRHRYFEICPILAMSPATCQHIGRPVVINPGSNARRGRNDQRRRHHIVEYREAMQISWMTSTEIIEAIPPIYTKYIGGVLPSNNPPPF